MFCFVAPPCLSLTPKRSLSPTPAHLTSRIFHGAPSPRRISFSTHHPIGILTAQHCKVCSRTVSIQQLWHNPSGGCSDGERHPREAGVAEGRPAFGPWSAIPDSFAMEQIFGLDHASLASVVRAGQHLGVAPVLRVPQDELR